MRVAGLALAGAMLVAAGCTTLRERELPPTRQGLIDAVKLALSQPGSAGAKEVDLQMTAEIIPPPSASWATYPRAGAELLDVMVLDRGMTADGVTESRRFAATTAGVAEARAYEAGRPKGERTALFQYRLNPTSSYAWDWMRGIPLADIHATKADICDSFTCWSYADTRRAFHRSAAEGAAETGPIGRFFDVSQETFPKQLADLKAGGAGGELAFEVRSSDAYPVRQIPLNTVTAIEADHFCGMINAPDIRAEQCFAFRDLQRVSVMDANRSLLEATSDVVSAPFRVVGTLAALAQ